MRTTENRINSLRANHPTRSAINELLPFGAHLGPRTVTYYLPYLHRSDGHQCEMDIHLCPPVRVRVSADVCLGCRRENCAMLIGCWPRGCLVGRIKDLCMAAQCSNCRSVGPLVRSPLLTVKKAACSLRFPISISSATGRRRSKQLVVRGGGR